MCAGNDHRLMVVGEAQRILALPRAIPNTIDISQGLSFRGFLSLLVVKRNFSLRTCSHISGPAGRQKENVNEPKKIKHNKKGILIILDEQWGRLCNFGSRSTYVVFWWPACP